MHPDRPKLADRLAEELRANLRAGRWNGWLPQERHVAAEFKASRASLRQALASLRAEGLLESVPRKGNRLTGRRSRPSAAPRTRILNLLLPGEADEIRPTVVQWVDELRALFAGKGWRLSILAAKACYGRAPERPLRDLFRRNPADCWLVRLSTQPMQRWLEQCGQPVVIAGTCHPGIALPFVDLDHRALTRHAAGAILAAGHRHIMLLVDADEKAGDLESERGFAEAANRTLHPDLTTITVRHNGRIAGVIAQIDRALRWPARPTAILLTQAIFCLTIWSYLASRGLRIPQSISVVTQVGAPYLSYLYPEPTSYRINQRRYAQLILRALGDAMTASVGRKSYLLLPEFVAGASLAKPQSRRRPR